MNPDDSNSYTDSNKKLQSVTYEKASENYQVDQVKVEKDPKFHWVNGERMYSDNIEDKVLLTESVRKNIR